MAHTSWSILHTNVIPAESAGAYHDAHKRSAIRTRWRRTHPGAEVKHSIRTIKAFGAKIRMSVLVVRVRGEG